MATLNPMIPLAGVAPPIKMRDPLEEAMKIAQIKEARALGDYRRAQTLAQLSELGERRWVQQQMGGLLTPGDGAGPPGAGTPGAGMAPGAPAPGAGTAGTLADLGSPWRGTMAGQVPPAPSMGQDRYITGPPSGQGIRPEMGTTYTRAPNAMQNLGVAPPPTPPAAPQSVATMQAQPQSAPTAGRQLSLEDQLAQRHQLYERLMLGGGKYGKEVVEQLRLMDTHKLAQMKATLEQRKSALEITAQVMGSATDQASWTRGRQELTAMGIPAQGLPQEYSPQMVAEVRNRAVTATQQVEHELRRHDVLLRQQAEQRLERTEERQLREGRETQADREARLRLEERKAQTQVQPIEVGDQAGYAPVYPNIGSPVTGTAPGTPGGATAPPALPPAAPPVAVAGTPGVPGRGPVVAPPAAPGATLNPQIPQSGTAPPGVTLLGPSKAALQPFQTAAADVLKKRNEAGLAAEGIHRTLDEIEGYIEKGVYETGLLTPEIIALYKTRKIVPPSYDEAKLARTVALMERGASLVTAMGSLGNNISE
jgi:hypothetical protein